MDDAVPGALIALVNNSLMALVTGAVVGIMLGPFWAVMAVTVAGSYGCWSAVDVVLRARDL